MYKYQKIKWWCHNYGQEGRLNKYSTALNNFYVSDIHDFVCLWPSRAGATKVFDATVREVSNAYQAGSTSVLLRVSQGSAIVTTPAQNGQL